jgi:mycothiol system anti-sigma-R factor
MWTYLDQALERTSTDELEEHLETCQRCCGELEFSRHVRQIVASGDGAVVLPPDLRTRIEELMAGRGSEPRGAS